MDAAFKIAIAAEDGHRHHIVFLNGRANRVGQRATVADAGGAPVAHEIEFEFIEILREARRQVDNP